MPPRARSRFRLAGLTIDVVADDPGVVAGIEHRLVPLRVDDDAGAADFRFDIGDATATVQAPAGTKRCVYDAPAGGIDYYDDTDELFVDYDGAIRVRCRPAGGEVDIAIDEPDAGRVLAVNPFFTIPLLELAKRRGRYPLHTACVAADGRGLLLAGGSGAGKTTLAIALARAGLTFLGDDIVFLVAGDDGRGTRAYALPDQIDVTDTTVAMFPELRALRGAPLPAGRTKHAARLEHHLTVDAALVCDPGALVVCEITGSDPTIVEPLPASEALVALAPNVLLTEPAASQAHLDALGALVRSVPCYRVRTGRDVDAAAQTLRTLLA